MSDSQPPREATSRVLILFAHPALERSRVNKHLARAVRDLDGVTFHDLYEQYPDYDIDVAREQRLLTDHEIVLMQHPFYWYSTPSMLKEWQDLVLEHGWAYGKEGTALNGKTMLNAITTGAKKAAYAGGGFNRYTIREFLAPLERTAGLCGMGYLPPIAVHGTHSVTEAEVRGHAEDYVAIVKGLRDGSLDLEAARDWPRLNEHMDRLLSKRKGG